MTAGTAVALENVSFIRAARTILHDISLDIDAGQQWALLGPNGAGKSSLLSICSATTFPSRGTATILQSRMGRVDLRELRRSIAVVEARHQVMSDLGLLSIVLTGVTGTSELVPHWQPSMSELDRAAKCLADVGLPTESELRWRTMSSGERGRALIARALMAEPRLLVLDEPSTGLDLVGREIMLRTIDDLPVASPGITTVVVTHYFEELPRGTTHAALLRDGTLVDAGPVDQVLTDANVSRTFDHPISVIRGQDGRWHASAQ